MRVVIEKGQDQDGFNAAAVCRESTTTAADREVLYRAIIKGTGYNRWVPPVLRSRIWALLHGHGVVRVVDAFYVI